MKENMYRVFFYDGEDKSTGEYISLEEAFAENYVLIVGNKIVPTDECSLIEEYTGLKDNTKWEDLTEAERTDWTRSGKLPSEWEGKEIYEGDIVRWEGHNLQSMKDYIVKFDRGAFEGVRIDLRNMSVQLSILTAQTMHSIPCEIIGNIHQNPELLEDK